MNDTTTNLGRSDFEVGTALRDMLDTLNTMIEKTSWTHPRLTEVSRAHDGDIQVAFCLDPRKIDEEYTRLRNAAFVLSENGEAAVKLRTAKHHLGGWQGNAADAFRAHMDHLELFTHNIQYTGLTTALQSLNALFAMAFHMRQSYHDMARLVESAALHEQDEQRERIEKVKLAIGKEFVKSALSMDPKKLVAVDFVVESVGALTEAWIEGTGADAVIDSYLKHSQDLRLTFETELGLLTHHLNEEYNGQLEHEGELKALQPIHVASGGITDVSGPKFSYAEFYTEEYPKEGPFVGRVEEERKEYAEEKRQQQESEISRRLEGEE